MVTNFSCLFYNNPPLVDYKPDDGLPEGLHFSAWHPCVEVTPETAIAPAQKFVVLSATNGQKKVIPQMTPYSPEWVRVWKGRLWSAIEEHGLPNKFVTLTYQDGFFGEFSREDEEEYSSGFCAKFSKHYENFMKRLKRYTGKPLKYFRVLEFGSLHGRLHFHVAFWNLPYIPDQVLTALWRAGRVWIVEPKAMTVLRHKDLHLLSPSQLREILRVNDRDPRVKPTQKIRYHLSGLVGYLLKYLLKSDLQLELRPKNIRVVQPSRGLIPSLRPRSVIFRTLEFTSFNSLDYVREYLTDQMHYIPICPIFDSVLENGWDFEKVVDEKDVPVVLPTWRRDPRFLPCIFDNNPCHEWNAAIDRKRHLEAYKRSVSFIKVFPSDL